MEVKAVEGKAAAKVVAKVVVARAVGAREVAARALGAREVAARALGAREVATKEAIGRRSKCQSQKCNR